MPEPLFLSLTSSRLALEMFGAKVAICYAAPGILPEPADALAALSRQIGPELITVCLDFDERVPHNPALAWAFTPALAGRLINEMI